MPQPTIRPFDPAADLGWAEPVLEAAFGGRHQARRGELMDPLAGQGLVAVVGTEPAGLVTWATAADEAEIRLLVTLERFRGRGLATALLDAAATALRAAGARRAWLVTTNDNLEALRFYQRRGWRLSALRPGAVDAARRQLKPSIGLAGAHGIPLRDELELTLDLDAAPAGPPPDSAPGPLG